MKVSSFNVQANYLIHNNMLDAGNLYSYLRCIRVASKQFGKRWDFRPLVPAEQDAVVLPQHKHFEGWTSMELVGRGGLTARQAAERVLDHPGYHHTNPECWQKLNYLKDHAEVVYVSREPISQPTYEQLDDFGPNHLYHLDGLHTLVALALKRLQHDVQGDQAIPAYIAG